MGTMQVMSCLGNSCSLNRYFENPVKSCLGKQLGHQDQMNGMCTKLKIEMGGVKILIFPSTKGTGKWDLGSRHILNR